MIVDLVSWVAVAGGFAGMWVAARRPVGWLIGAACAALWLVYDVDHRVWAGVAAALPAVGINVRNWHVQRGLLVGGGR